MQSQARIATIDVISSMHHNAEKMLTLSAILNKSSLNCHKTSVQTRFQANSLTGTSKCTVFTTPRRWN